MADQNEKKEESKKKNPAPAAKSIRRKKKKGPSAAVKVPLGKIFILHVYPQLLMQFQLVLNLFYSVSYFEMQVEIVEAGANKGLFAHGTRIHPKSGNTSPQGRAKRCQNFATNSFVYIIKSFSL